MCPSGLAAISAFDDLFVFNQAWRPGVDLAGHVMTAGLLLLDLTEDRLVPAPAVDDEFGLVDTEFHGREIEELPVAVLCRITDGDVDRWYLGCCRDGGDVTVGAVTAILDAELAEEDMYLLTILIVLHVLVAALPVEFHHEVEVVPEGCAREDPGADTTLLLVVGEQDARASVGLHDLQQAVAAGTIVSTKHGTGLELAIVIVTVGSNNAVLLQQLLLDRSALAVGPVATTDRIDVGYQADALGAHDEQIVVAVGKDFTLLLRRFCSEHLEYFPVFRQ